MLIHKAIRAVNILKILHIITRLDMGGSALALMLIAALQKRRGYDVAVAHGPTGNHQDAAFLGGAGVTVHYIPSLVRDIEPLKDIHALFSVWSLIRMTRPDVVHTHTSKAGFVGRLGARLAGCRAVVHSPHGHVFSGYFSPYKSSMFVLLERIAARFCDRILPLTSAEADEYAARGVAPMERMQPVPMGVSLEGFKRPSVSRREARLALGIPEDAAVAGWVGRLDPVKDCGTFIASYRAVSEGCAASAGVWYVVVGDGPEGAAIRTRADAAGGGRIVLTGRRDDVGCLLQAMDVFALTSLNEGLGMVLVEAMAAGVPVVATEVGGVPEVLGDAGFMVPPGDPQALARKLARLLADEGLRKEFADRGRARAERYSIESTERVLAGLYEEVLAGAGLARGAAT